MQNSSGKKSIGSFSAKPCNVNHESIDCKANPIPGEMIGLSLKVELTLIFMTSFIIHYIKRANPTAHTSVRKIWVKENLAM